MHGLGAFDVVYAWGVLHHTGAMWVAMDNALTAVAPGGTLWISLYNDQGRRSDLWRAVKRAYNQAPEPLRPLMVWTLMALFEGRDALRHVVTGRSPFHRDRDEAVRQRGMSRTRDWVDWVGGYPFEVATPEEVIDWAVGRGLAVQKVRTVGGSWGCNEFVLVRSTSA